MGSHGGFLKVRRIPYGTTRSHSISLFLRSKTRKQKKFKHNRLLDMEMEALQGELAKFILAEILEKNGRFSVARSVKYKNQYGLEKIRRLVQSNI